MSASSDGFFTGPARQLKDLLHGRRIAVGAICLGISGGSDQVEAHVVVHVELDADLAATGFERQTLRMPVANRRRVRGGKKQKHPRNDLR